MSRPAARIVRRRFFMALGRAIHLAWPVLSVILAVQVALGLLIGLLEGWSVGDALYFTFVTGLTIGYGDIVPRQALARVLGVGIGICGLFLTGPHSRNCGLCHARSAPRPRHRLKPRLAASQHSVVCRCAAQSSPIPAAIKRRYAQVGNRSPPIDSVRSIRVHAAALPRWSRSGGI